MDDELRKAFDDQNAKLDELKRGLYGDKPNKFKGLIDRVQDLETALTYILFVVKRPVLSLVLLVVFLDIINFLANKGMDGLFVLLTR